MSSEHENEPVWVTQKQINDHIKSFGQPGYNSASDTVKGKTEEPAPVSDIMVRKVEGHIAVIDGRHRLEIMLREFGEAKVRFPSGRVATVVRIESGQLVEK